MHVRPLQDRVLVKRIQAETKTTGGIIIPDSNKEKPSEGEVVSVGEEAGIAELHGDGAGHAVEVVAHRREGQVEAQRAGPDEEGE